ncbi:MAG: hypothetical protein AAF497_06660 [Planctomycetota bacterium]
MNTQTTPTLLKVSIIPASSSQVSVLWKALAELIESNRFPLVKVSSDSDTGETELEGVGYQHLHVFINELKTMGCEFEVAPFRLIAKRRTVGSGYVPQQPIMKVEIKVPSAKQDVVKGLISYHRGEIKETRDLADDGEANLLVSTELPLAELENFPDELRGISEHASFSSEFLEYRDSQ